MNNYGTTDEQARLQGSSSPILVLPAACLNHHGARQLVCKLLRASSTTIIATQPLEPEELAQLALLFSGGYQSRDHVHCQLGKRRSTGPSDVDCNQGKIEGVGVTQQVVNQEALYQVNSEDLLDVATMQSDHQMVGLSTHRGYNGHNTQPSGSFSTDRKRQKISLLEAASQPVDDRQEAISSIEQQCLMPRPWVTDANPLPFPAALELLHIPLVSQDSLPVLCEQLLQQLPDGSRVVTPACLQVRNSAGCSVSIVDAPASGEPGADPVDPNDPGGRYIGPSLPVKACADTKPQSSYTQAVGESDTCNMADLGSVPQAEPQPRDHWKASGSACQTGHWNEPRQRGEGGMGAQRTLDHEIQPMPAAPCGWAVNSGCVSISLRLQTLLHRLPKSKLVLLDFDSPTHLALLNPPVPSLRQMTQVVSAPAVQLDEKFLQSILSGIYVTSHCAMEAWDMTAIDCCGAQMSRKELAGIKFQAVRATSLAGWREAGDGIVARSQVTHGKYSNALAPEYCGATAAGSQGRLGEADNTKTGGSPGDGLQSPRGEQQKPSDISALIVGGDAHDNPLNAPSNAQQVAYEQGSAASDTLTGSVADGNTVPTARVAVDELGKCEVKHQSALAVQTCQRDLALTANVSGSKGSLSGRQAIQSHLSSVLYSAVRVQPLTSKQRRSLQIDKQGTAAYGGSSVAISLQQCGRGSVLRIPYGNVPSLQEIAVAVGGELLPRADQDPKPVAPTLQGGPSQLSVKKGNTDGQPDKGTIDAGTEGVFLAAGTTFGQVVGRENELRHSVLRIAMQSLLDSIDQGRPVEVSTRTQFILAKEGSVVIFCWEEGIAAISTMTDLNAAQAILVALLKQFGTQL